MSASKAEGGESYYLKILFWPLLQGCRRMLPAEGAHSFGGQEASMARCGWLESSSWTLLLD